MKTELLMQRAHGCAGAAAEYLRLALGTSAPFTNGNQIQPRVLHKDVLMQRAHGCAGAAADQNLRRLSATIVNTNENQIQPRISTWMCLCRERMDAQERRGWKDHLK